jgi:hypothetical protein
MKIIRPDYIPNDEKVFYERFCDPYYKGNIIEFLGCTYCDELKLLFDKRFAVKSSDSATKISQGKNDRLKIEIDGC